MGLNPPIWQMIKKAVEASNNQVVTYREIKDYIVKNYDGVKESTINCQIIVCSVNQPSRIHYPENSKPRIANGQYDFLYNVDRGKVVLYNSSLHGVWEIKNENGKLIVKRTDDDASVASTVITSDDTVNGAGDSDNDFSFGFESQLRDFIALNLSLINGDLQLYTSDDGITGVEYRTPIGVIDILAQDKNGEFVVFELKLSRGPDAALGQLQRYMGWVKSNLADGKTVNGIIIAKSISDKLKYAVSVTQNIALFEYKINFDISKVGLS